MRSGNHDSTSDCEETTKRMFIEKEKTEYGNGDSNMGQESKSNTAAEFLIFFRTHRKGLHRLRNVPYGYMLNRAHGPIEANSSSS